MQYHFLIKIEFIMNIKNKYYFLKKVHQKTIMMIDQYKCKMQYYLYTIVYIIVFIYTILQYYIQ